MLPIGNVEGRRSFSRHGQESERVVGGYKVDPDAVREIYANWIIPLSKEVQVRYLLARL